MKLLANAKNREIIALLAAGPSHPRALAHALGLSEDGMQRKLHRLEDAGIIEGAWRYHGKTVKEYALLVSGVALDIDPTGVTVRLRAPEE